MLHNIPKQRPTPAVRCDQGGKEIDKRPVSKRILSQPEPHGNNPHYGKLCSDTTIQALALLIVLGMVNLVDLDLVALGINRAELVGQISIFEGSTASMAR
jgi:hypothetical protein